MSTNTYRYDAYNPDAVSVRAGEKDGQFIVTNATIDSAPMGAAALYLKGEGKGGVLETKTFQSKEDRAAGKAQPQPKVLEWPQLTRDKAKFSMMVTPRLPTALVEANDGRATKIRKAQYEFALKTRLAYEKALRCAFDENLGGFAPIVLQKKKAATKNARQSKGDALKRELSEDEFAAMVASDATLAARINERAFAAFLDASPKDVLDPRLYNWNTLGDVELIEKGKLRPNDAAKPYPARYSFFADWYAWSNVFDEDGKMLFKPKTADLTVSTFKELPSTPDNYTRIAAEAFRDNMKLAPVRFSKRVNGVSVKCERNEKVFVAADGQSDVRLPDPWWCEVDPAREEFMVTLRVTLKLFTGGAGSTPWGVRTEFANDIEVSYRVDRPRSEAVDAGPMSSTSDLFEVKRAAPETVPVAGNDALFADGNVSPKRQRTAE